jgi:antitoxin VapB
MALQIANPRVVEKVERLAATLSLTKTALIEKAVDRLASESPTPDPRDRIGAILKQADAVPDRADAYDPLEWDENGLPK